MFTRQVNWLMWSDMQMHICIHRGVSVYLYTYIYGHVYMYIYIYIYIHLHSTTTTINIVNILIISQGFSMSLCYPTLLTASLFSGIHWSALLLLITLHFLEFCINGVIQYVILLIGFFHSAWLFWISSMLLHVLTVYFKIRFFTKLTWKFRGLLKTEKSWVLQIILYHKLPRFVPEVAILISAGNPQKWKTQNRKGANNKWRWTAKRTERRSWKHLNFLLSVTLSPAVLPCHPLSLIHPNLSLKVFLLPSSSKYPTSAINKAFCFYHLPLAEQVKKWNYLLLKHLTGHPTDAVLRILNPLTLEINLSFSNPRVRTPEAGFICLPYHISETSAQLGSLTHWLESTLIPTCDQACKEGCLVKWKLL